MNRFSKFFVFAFLLMCFGIASINAARPFSKKETDAAEAKVKKGQPLTDAERLELIQAGVIDKNGNLIPPSTPAPSVLQPASPSAQAAANQLTSAFANTINPCASAGAPGSLEYQACECSRVPGLANLTNCENLQKYAQCMRDHNQAHTAQEYCKCISGLQTTGCN